MNMMDKPTVTASIKRIERQYYFSKIAVNFFSILYLVAGLGMLFVTYKLEAEVFLTILGDSELIAYLTAACLEAAKLGTIIVYDFISRKKQAVPDENSGSAKLAEFAQLLLKRFFQLSLFLISMLCVATVISKEFDRPNLHSIQDQDLVDLKTKHERARTQLIASQKEEQARLSNQQTTRKDDINARFQPLIDKANHGLEKERHNIGRNGVVMGSQYQSYQAMLDENQQQLTDALNQDRETSTKEINEQTLLHAGELKTLEDQFVSKEEQIKTSTYDNDPRVFHPNIHAVVKTLNAVLPLFGFQDPIQPITYVALFAVMLSAIIECAIFLSLSSFIEVFLPQDFDVIEMEMAQAQKKTSRYG